MDHSIPLQVEVEGRYIIVTIPGTSFLARYYSAIDSLTLLQSNHLMNESSAAISHREFEKHAREAANDKARELGWIRYRRGTT